MKRKPKFDIEWNQALDLLGDAEATQARAAIESYQLTGEMPGELTENVKMILLLVKPLIDRRRRAALAARRRREERKGLADVRETNQLQSVDKKEERLAAEPAGVVLPKDSTKSKPQINDFKKRHYNRLKKKRGKQGLLYAKH